MTPDAHMVETLRLRTAALHRVSRSNDQLRRENDNLRKVLADVRRLVHKWDEQYCDEWSLDDLRAILDGTP